MKITYEHIIQEVKKLKKIKINQNRLTEIVELMVSNANNHTEAVVSLDYYLSKNNELVYLFNLIEKASTRHYFVIGFYIGKLYAETLNVPENSKH